MKTRQHFHLMRHSMSLLSATLYLEQRKHRVIEATPGGNGCFHLLSIAESKEGLRCPQIYVF
jgi:hypothetical protein